MQTFAIVDGDLVLAAGSYLTVQGPNKIKQDLFIALREHYGADPYHPAWGTVLARFLGQPLTPALEQSVYNEVIRVVSNYMTVQADMVRVHNTMGTKSVLNTADIVAEITAARSVPVGAELLVNVSLKTMAGAALSVQAQVSG